MPILLLLVCSCTAGQGLPQQASVPASGTYPGVGFLSSSEPLQKPLATLSYTPPGKTLKPAQPMTGVISLDSSADSNQIEVLKDTFGISREDRWELSSLPRFAFEFVSDGTDVIPVQRHPQRSDHPYWEIILGPGRTWTDPDDTGWSRAALPFSLKEKNQNCTHNGLMTFLYRPDGSITRTAWQIGSETCLYLKFNLWGMANTTLQPQGITSSEDIITAYHDEVQNRLKVKPLAALADDYPGLNPAAFKPPGKGESSVYGFVIDDVHYRSECQTRHGPYPYCESFSLPSYSLAKSVFAGLGYLLLTRQWPEFADMEISHLIPECDLDDKRWTNVSPRHLLNMTTGLYESTEFEKDEGSSAMEAFFLAETRDEKTRISCEIWPRKAVAGTTAVYHTTDHYLLGVAMSHFLKQKLGPHSDIYDNLIVGQFLEELELSPAAYWTQRTYDLHEQPFVAYGLIFLVDDIARIAATINSDSTLLQNFESTGFRNALFRGDEHVNVWTSQHGKVAYQNGFWGFDAAEAIGCEQATWIPFMSGYGGIVVAMLPNGSVYYYFSDSDQHRFKETVIEVDSVFNLCKES